jgi:pSer/pThr/pTyr-binding forkhead associated (FHA) protein
MNVSLVMFKTDGTRRDFSVDKPRIVIGRTNSCDLRIPLSSVSRQHCEIRIEGEEVKLRDLGSSNGTYHNSVRIQEVVLKPGDEVAIGPVIFNVVIDGQPADLKPVRSGAGAGEVERPTPTAAKPPEDEEELIELEPEQEPAPAQAEQPQKLDINQDEELVLPAAFDEQEETQTPTIDLDDPIAALQAMAEQESADSGEIPLLEEDEDKN